MKKLFIPALILLSSLTAQAYYHTEQGRATVTLSGCTLGGYYYNEGATCARAADGSVTVTFSSAYNVMPYCHLQPESGGTAFWVNPALDSLKVNSVSSSAAILMPVIFSYDCTAY